MHAMHDELNIKKMGGLYKSMKYTAILMIIASVALAGIYPFAGFFSKDKILEVALNENTYVLFGALFVGAGLTAFYSFRLIALVFFGKKEHEKYKIHPHEASLLAILAMLPLGILAMISGFFENWFHSFVTNFLPEYVFNVEHDDVFMMIVATSTIAILGILFALLVYILKGGFSKKIESNFIYKLLSNQYYIPRFYENYIVRAFIFLSNFAYKQIDAKIIDKSVDLIAKLTHKAGDDARAMQSGNLSGMLRWMVFGLVVLLLLALVYRA
jgi:NADH-quinone oxidoreductase subunit L